MKISKKTETFDMYSLELSYSQLLSVQAALKLHHADPVADELSHGVDWSLERLPRPGEDERKDDDTVLVSNSPKPGPDDEEFDIPNIDDEETGLPAPDAEDAELEKDE